jgi:hypothetical protein
MRRLSTALLATLLLACPALAGPNYAPATLDRYFGIEYRTATGARGPVLEGYVYNRTAMLADRMRLHIEMLDATGRVLGSTTTWVLGGVPPDNRAWFQAPVPPAASYRVEVLSFDWVGRGGGGQ